MPNGFSTQLLPDDSTFYIDTNLEQAVQDFLGISPALITPQLARTFPTLFPPSLGRGALFSRAANPQAINLFPQSIGRFLNPVSRLFPATILYNLGPSTPRPPEGYTGVEPLNLPRSDNPLLRIFQGPRPEDFDHLLPESQVSVEDVQQQFEVIPDVEASIPRQEPNQQVATTPPKPVISQQDAVRQATGRAVQFARRSGGRYSAFRGPRSVRTVRAI